MINYRVLSIYLSIISIFNIFFCNNLFSQIQENKDLSFNISVNYEHGLDTDIDEGGKFNVNKYSVKGSIHKTLNGRLGLDVSSSYSFTDFDFSENKGIAGSDPWDLINRASLGFRLNYNINRVWTISAGPFIRYSGERGANFADSLKYGGIAAFIYAPNRNIFLGTGLYISTRIEDSISVYPGLIIHWNINERLRISTLLTGIKSELGPRIQINYDIGREIDTGISLGYETQRFRLDDDGVAKNGVGNTKGLPVWASIGYAINESLRLEVYSGLGFIGELELENENGDRIDKEDFDTMFFIGGGVKINI